MQFFKYHALGNDMLVLDPASFKAALTPAAIRLLCHRHYGLGADGICYGPLPGEAIPTMRFFNPDGSEAEKSGNGLRIFARYLWDQGYTDQRQYPIRIGDQISQALLQDEAGQRIRLTMGTLSFQSATVPVSGPAREVVDEALEVAGREYRITAVNIGNPHCVIFDHEVSAAAARAYGPAIEASPHFPNRVNVQFARVIDRHTLQIEIWERGAGYTLASGTSGCAAAGAAIRTGRCASPVTVVMAGGSAEVSIDERGEVSLTGAVTAVAQGNIAPQLAGQLGGDFP